MSPAELTRSLLESLGGAIRRQRNLIVRPYGPGVKLVQADGLKAEKLPALAPTMFLTIDTSAHG